MRVLVLNGSPSGEDSITLQTVWFIRQHFKETKFEVLHVGRRIRSLEKDFSEAEAALKRADLILFCYPVYTFLVPAQLHRFIELIKEHGVDLRGKYATQLSTSKHFYDVTAHQFVQDNCDDLGLRYIRGLSADMEDLLKVKGQREALEFFRYVRWCMKNHLCEPRRVPEAPGGGSPDTERAFSEPEETAGEAAGGNAVRGNSKTAIVADLPAEGGDALREMIRRFERECPMECVLINIREFPFQGGCLGCFHCAADGTCIYKDGFDRYLREHIQNCDAIVYAFTVRDHSMGSRFKMFDDRQFCNGHRTVTMGKPVGYLVDGTLSAEANLMTVMEARSQVGGNFLAGIACNETDLGIQIRKLAKTLKYAADRKYDPPKNFYGVGGLKVFRDLIWQMQGLMREDHRFYKKHGFYDFPQKQRGKMLAMYLVGFMMNNKNIRKKTGSRMREGMLMPYRNVLKQAEGNLRKKERPAAFRSE